MIRTVTADNTVHSLKKRSCPRHHGTQDDGNKEENTVLARMFRGGKASEIVISDKSIRERRAVNRIHGNVPGQTDEKSKKYPPGDFHFFQQSPAARKNNIEQHDYCRKGVTDGTFGEKCQAASCIGGIILFSVKSEHRKSKCKDESHIRDGRFTDINKPERCQENDSRAKGNMLIENSPTLNVDSTDCGQAHYGAG